jgi:hypothetical protein
VATSEITRENTSVAYVLAFANFYCDARGFEPLDPRIVRVQKWLQQIACENTSVPYVFDFYYFIGAAKRIRTPDPRITNALLYQLSYCGMPLKGAAF